MIRILLIVMVALGSVGMVGAQEDGLVLNTDAAYPGYTLFAPLNSTTTYLIDNDGQVVHTWESRYRPGNAVYLLENGHLLRTAALNPRGIGGTGGRVEEYTWAGELVWSFEYYDDTVRLHHDIEPMPNGNILMIAWELKTAEDLAAAGRTAPVSTRGPQQQGGDIPDGAIWIDHVIEVDPASNEIVWEWHLWDHLVQDRDPNAANYGDVVAQPGRVDVNYVVGPAGGPDWTHTNSIDYNPALDQIVLSVHNFNEIWIIDHNTTTAAAAGPAGDLLYRWGNPAAYKTAGEQQLFNQHDAQWVESGNILIFNNGNRRLRAYSSVDEIVPPLNADGTYTPDPTLTPIWSYVAPTPTDFYAMNISGAQRLPNGNTLVCDGPVGRFFEVTAAGDVVWEYVNPYAEDTPAGRTPPGRQGPGQQQGNPVFRAIRYAMDYPGLKVE